MVKVMLPSSNGISARISLIFSELAQLECAGGSLVVAAEKTAVRIFLFISSDAAISTETMDNVTRRAMPRLFFRNFIVMNSILILSSSDKPEFLPWS